jgi:hypothetical protein
MAARHRLHFSECMPWKKGALASPYYAFIASVWDRRASSAAVRRARGISRPTGYKWFKRFLQQGLTGLREQSRRPQRLARQTAAEIRELSSTCAGSISGARRRPPRLGVANQESKTPLHFPNRSWPFSVPA